MINYAYNFSGVEVNPHFEKINSLLVWADERGRYADLNHAILARPLDETVTEWDGVPNDSLAIRCDGPSYMWKSEYYSYVQIKVTGRKDRKVPCHPGLYGRKVKVTFSDGDVREGFAVQFVEEEW